MRMHRQCLSKQTLCRHDCGPVECQEQNSRDRARLRVWPETEMQLELMAPLRNGRMIVPGSVYEAAHIVLSSYGAAFQHLGLSCHHEQGLREKQSGGEFASGCAPARAQDATLQISGIGATLSERSCRRPQYLQPPAPSRLPVDASDLPIRSGGAMAQRDHRGMTIVRAPVF